MTLHSGSWQAKPWGSTWCLRQNDPTRPAAVLAKRTHRGRPRLGRTNPTGIARCLGRTNPTVGRCPGSRNELRRHCARLGRDTNLSGTSVLSWRNEANGTGRCLGGTNPPTLAASWRERTHWEPTDVLAERSQRERPLSWPNKGRESPSVSAERPNGRCQRFGRTNPPRGGRGIHFRFRSNSVRGRPISSSSALR